MSQETIRQLLNNAYRALQRGDKREARRWAELAAEAFPEQEEPWLILAGVATPRASVAYIEKALRINPQSKRARQGMAWAQARLLEEEKNLAGQEKPAQRRTHQSEPEPQKQIQTPAPMRDVSSEPAARQTGSSQVEARDPITAQPRHSFHAEPPKKAPILSEKALAKRRHSLLPLLLLVACASIAWALWPGNASPALAFLYPKASETPGTATLPGGAADIAKPTYTPTATATLTPTPTFTATPTFTPTLTPTDTPTVTPTDLPSPTPLPSNTPKARTTPSYNAEPGSEGERWIDVDLSGQRVYAYEGDTLITSFIVSTGTWKHPTVTGQYYIYVKMRYSDMSGPDYFLRDVPYTMYFYKGYALHGTYWHSNFGTPMSHGCINLRTEDAAWLFNFASVGTLVNIHQ